MKIGSLWRAMACAQKSAWVWGMCVVQAGCGGGSNTGFVPASPPAAASTTAAAVVLPNTAPDEAAAPVVPSLEGIEYADVATLSQKMAQGATSHAITAYLLDRIGKLDKQGPAINAIIELNPDALAIADQLDAERASGKLRGPLHGIPILLKDNIDTGDKMQTTAGSLAMVGLPALKDAFIAKKLRDAGAVILGKTNLSEWAMFRDNSRPSGWSGRGGQTRNPHVLTEDPCGSSSGSGAGVAAGYAPFAIGTETDGSIMCPLGANGIVGIRPTLGLASRSGIIPITSEQDTPGPMARTVRDAAILLSAIAGSDAQDAATAEAQPRALDFTQFLNADGLRGKRVGYSVHVAPEDHGPFGKALRTMNAAGAVLVPVELPYSDPSKEEALMAFYFCRELNSYLKTRVGLLIANVEDLVQFNKLKPLDEAGKPYPQGLIEAALASPYTDITARIDADIQKTQARAAIDKVLSDNKLDALVDDSYSGGAVAGYPRIAVPNGVGALKLPDSVYFMGTRWSEPTLLAVAYGFEQATHGWTAPGFLPKLPPQDPAENSPDEAMGGQDGNGSVNKNP